MAILFGALAPCPFATAETLRVGTISTVPCSEPARPAGQATRVTAVRLAGDRQLDLSTAVQPAPCGAPLSIEIAGDWAEVSIETGKDPALVEFGSDRRWVEAASRRTIELGARIPSHAWADPTPSNYRRSLADADALQELQDGRQVVSFNGLFDLNPYPGLAAARVLTDRPVVFPDVFVPQNAVARFGLAADRAMRIRIDVDVELRNGVSQETHETVEIRGDQLARIELPLETTRAGRGTVRLRMQRDDSVESASLQLVDPEITGIEPVGPPRNKRPNVVLVTLDTVRADHLSLYGYDRPTTPFLDEIEKDLLVFDNAYSQVPSTRPSHFSMFTSRYPRDLGIWANSDPPLPRSELALAEILQSAGWRTGAVLSVRFLASDGGAAQGFDEVVLPPKSPQAQLGKHTTEHAIDFMRDSSAEPFFLWVHYFDAHLPYQPIPELRGLFWDGPPPTDVDIERDLIEKEGFGTLHALPHRAYMTAMYDASIRYLDDQMRELFRFLEENGTLDDTVIVIASDHGESLGEHGVYFSHDGLHEPNVRVPLIVRLPKTTRSGHVEAIVENLGIAPTVLDAVGIRQPASFRGTTLLTDTPGSDAAFFEQGKLFSGVRSGSFKWIDGRGFMDDPRFIDSNLRKLREEPPLALYDLDTDPGESRNLVTDRPEDADALQRRLSGWEADPVDPARQAEDREVDPEMRERLRALGYTE